MGGLGEHNPCDVCCSVCVHICGGRRSGVDVGTMGWDRIEQCKRDMRSVHLYGVITHLV
jgi:hypothetical protein